MLPGIYATTESTVQPAAFDPHLDVEFEVGGKGAGRSVRCRHRDRRLEGPDAELVPGVSQLRTRGLSGTPSQL
ncbi:hypothetical protein Sgleb_73640 [Streptomyces glebosus]|uniref:Uncharacterized protein n=1 Tax=Streptomyces glebosus TaxID=249580 RepID=A0A640T6G6_9ACTN|nr:hypothetical protein Sgleb_73640 [Streptomyces glebosus]GHG79276.1 hypothetical protein GCM10010513_56520 [Streptomyces glebosus]